MNGGRARALNQASCAALYDSSIWSPYGGFDLWDPAELPAADVERVTTRLAALSAPDQLGAISLAMQEVARCAPLR